MQATSPASTPPCTLLDILKFMPSEVNKYYKGKTKSNKKHFQKPTSFRETRIELHNAMFALRRMLFKGKYFKLYIEGAFKVV
jgi:hypothetical protein